MKRTHRNVNKNRIIDKKLIVTKIRNMSITTERKKERNRKEN